MRKLNIKQTFPFNPAKSPFFYGWIILFAGTIGIIMSIPGQTMGVSVFTEHLKDAFDLTRVELSQAYMIGTILSGTLLTKVGKLYDRLGARIIIVCTSICLSAVLIYLTKIDQISDNTIQLFPFLKKTFVTSVFMTIGFFGIRFFGQGIMTMVSRNMVMKWFDKKRGLANSIMGVFVSFGFSYSPRLFNTLINLHGWRGAWLFMSFVIGIIFLVFAIIFFRDNPENCGLIPDGKKIQNNKKRPLSHPPTDYTLKEALRTYSFWVFNLTMVLNGLYITAFTFQIESIFTNAHYPKETAVSIFLPISVVAVTLHITGSWLSDYYKLKNMLIANLLGMIISTIGLMILKRSPLGMYMIIAGNGIITGMFAVISAITWPRFFGTAHLGAISGFAMSWLVYGSALGPFFFSLSLKYLHSYGFAAFICFIFSFILFFMSFRADNVNEKNLTGL